jgi:metal-responsive CopG/Arc/MetJ family transcriptional regulator
MKEKVTKGKITISISQEVLKNLDDYRGKIKPVQPDRSPIIEIAIKEYLGREKK